MPSVKQKQNKTKKKGISATKNPPKTNLLSTTLRLKTTEKNCICGSQIHITSTSPTEATNSCTSNDFQVKTLPSGFHQVASHQLQANYMNENKKCHYLQNLTFRFWKRNSKIEKSELNQEDLKLLLFLEFLRSVCCSLHREIIDFDLICFSLEQ